MKTLLLIALIASLASGPALADCVTLPSAPAVPNGATASRDEMLAALQAVKTYDAAVSTYSECMQRTGGDTLESDSAIDRMHKIAERFNAELRAFKTKTGG